jgi:hypothetical protein
VRALALQARASLRPGGVLVLKLGSATGFPCMAESAVEYLTSAVYRDVRLQRGLREMYDGHDGGGTRGDSVRILTARSDPGPVSDG